MSLSLHRPSSQRGNTLIMVLGAIAVLSVVAANLLWNAASRYHTTYQSASWQEALVASEAGVDLAMVELRKRVRSGDKMAFLTPTSTPKGPWLSGNDSTAKVLTSKPVDRRLIGGAVDPTTAATYFDAATDPSASHPASLSPVYPENGHFLPLTALTTHGGEGNTQMWARVYVDVPGSLPAPATNGTNFASRPSATLDDFINEQSDLTGYDARSYWWYRIRSLGVAGVSGPARPSIDRRDTALRRFSFVTDWRANLPVITSAPNAPNGPQVSRLVEAVARPLTGFRNAIMADVRIDLQDQSVLIDSFNSANGLYGATYLDKNGKLVSNNGSNGNIATNGTLINAGGAVVKGDAATDDGTVEGAQNVSGDRRTDFYQELSKVPAPAKGTTSSLTLDGLSLNGSKSAGSSGSVYYDGSGDYIIPASSDRTNPTRVYLNGIDLTHGPATVELTGAVDKSPTYVKLIVSGDIRVNDPATTNGTNAIIIDSGVHAIVYLGGNMVIKGAGIANTDKAVDHLLINGVTPANPSSTPPVIQIQSTQDFQGIIYAPDHDVQLALQAVVTTTGGGGPVSGPAPPPPPPDKDAIKRLQDQIKPLQDQLKNVNKNIDDLQKDMTKNPVNTVTDTAQIATLQTTVSTLNSQIASIQAQINQLQTGNLLPDNGPQANDHALGYNGIYGGFIGRTITVGSKTHVHYDEALRQAGPVNHYTLTNWVEDTASHAAN